MCYHCHLLFDCKRCKHAGMYNLEKHSSQLLLAMKSQTLLLADWPPAGVSRGRKMLPEDKCLF